MLLLTTSSVVTFHTEGTTEYTTCAGLLTSSGGAWPQTSLFEIAASGVSLNKLVSVDVFWPRGILLSVALQVIGKPATAGDATNGYIAPATLAGCVSQAKAKGWSYVPLLFLSSFSHADRKQGRGHDLGVPRRCGFVDLDGTGTVLARLSTTASTAYTRALFLIATIGLRERDCRFRTVFDIGICILSVLRS